MVGFGAIPQELVRSLTNFLRAARERSQADIIRHFLRLIVMGAHIAESGSVLVYYGEEGLLRLFNDGDFLFKEGFLDPQKEWKLHFSADEGLAGLAFTTRERQLCNTCVSEPRFARDGGAAIATMVCIPIWVAQQNEPFGVVSFHNSDSKRPFDSDLVECAEMAVQCLGMALDASAERLMDSRRQAVFIVHGHDKTPLFWLQQFLAKHGVESIVLGEQERVGGELLHMLDAQIDRAAAAFVLLTPDDEGHARVGGDLDSRPRARQNVIFEAGMLSSRLRRERRVCFVKCGDLEMPTDMQGLFLEEFDPDDPPEDRFAKILSEWRLGGSHFTAGTRAGVSSGKSAPRFSGLP